MSTTKKRIATYVTEETVKKFKLISATKDKSMSEYAEEIIKKEIEEYEKQNGKLICTEDGEIVFADKLKEEKSSKLKIG